jgi:hypothetical protein
MLDHLDDVRWGDLRDAKGPAGEIPGLLRTLAGPSAKDAAKAGLELSKRLGPDGATTSAGAAAIPFLIEILAAPDSHHQREHPRHDRGSLHRSSPRLPVGRPRPRLPGIQGSIRGADGGRLPGGACGRTKRDSHVHCPPRGRLSFGAQLRRVRARLVPGGRGRRPEGPSPAPRRGDGRAAARERPPRRRPPDEDTPAPPGRRSTASASGPRTRPSPCASRPRWPTTTRTAPASRKRPSTCSRPSRASPRWTARSSPGTTASSTGSPIGPCSACSTAAPKRCGPRTSASSTPTPARSSASSRAPSPRRRCLSASKT